MYSEDNNQDQSTFEKASSKKKWYKRWWGSLMIVFLSIIVIFFVVVGAYGVFLSITGNSNLNIGDSSQIDLQKDVDFKFNVSNPSKGPDDARVVIVEFGDFQCPACGTVYPVIKEVMRKYGDRVKFVYRDFPVVNTHPQALTAAMAGQCANEQGKFWEMHDKLFENQGNLGTADLKKYAVQIGLNSLQFGDCFDSNKYLSKIEQDFKAGIEMGVDATPTFFVNGRSVVGAVSLEFFEKIILAQSNK